jgi:hypothetical protein
MRVRKTVKTTATLGRNGMRNTATIGGVARGAIVRHSNFPGKWTIGRTGNGKIG